MNWQRADISRKSVKLLLINYLWADEKVDCRSHQQKGPIGLQGRGRARAVDHAAVRARQANHNIEPAICAKTGKPSCKVKIRRKMKQAPIE